jgi:biopolymer transport protein ExbD
VDLSRHIKVPVLSNVGLMPFINGLVLIVVFFFILLGFAVDAPLNVRLPKAVTSDMAGDKSITIVVSSENIVYVNGRVTTWQELKGLLSRAKDSSFSVLIKADRRVSVGRIVDIWNMGRDLGIKNINVATDQEE